MIKSALETMLVLILAGGALLAVPGAGQARLPDDTAARITRVENGLRPPVPVKGQKTWNILERMKFYDIPGVSVAVFYDNRIVWAKGYGVMDTGTNTPVTAETLFLAGSISKPVSVMGALRLVQEGKLALDENINSFLRTWKVPENTFTTRQPVTLRRIVSHTAGLTVNGFRGYAAGEDVPDIVQILNGQPPANSAAVVVDIEPGSRWRYSGGGLTVMQLAMMDVQKKPFPEVMLDLVLAPIGMTDSSYEQTLPPERLKLAASGHNGGGTVIQGRRYCYPEMAAAGLWTTPTDLARFAIEVGRSAHGESNRVLGKELARLMVNPQIMVQAPDDFMALGFFLENRGSEVYFTHGGTDEGFVSSLYANRERGYGVVIMTNCDNRAGALINEITRSVAWEYGWHEVLPALQTVISLTENELAMFTGRYAIDSGSTLLVSMQGGQLVGKSTGASEFELLPVSARGFIRTDREVTYTFTDDPASHAGGVTIKTDRGTTIASRVAEGSLAPADWLYAGDIDRALAGYRETFRKNPAEPGVAQRRLNALGYRFLADGKLAPAIAIFQLNVEFYPGEPDVYDSLAEAYLKNGEKALALQFYEKTLAMNPGNANATKIVKELKGN